MALKKWILGAAAAASVLAAVPAAAVQVVFADIDLLNGNRNFLWARGGGVVNFQTTSAPNTFVPGSSLVSFSLVGSPVPLSVTGRFLLSGSTTGDPVGNNTGAFTQQVDSFTFSITATNSFCYGSQCFNNGDTLLSGSVLNSRITGTLGTTGPAQFSGSTASGSTITMSSPLVNFAPGSDFSFLFDLTNLDRNLAGSATAPLATYRSQISGSFLADAALAFNVPEPGTWALMIVGMGLVGVARRRRRPVVAA
ncbi:PEPxxWA-CTERM sorting domain-containing protein [Sandarakinorhabdus rubra]|uniref:PEPxxWA-CTERM sorting domain-containing protein n=1 Tax=Sandarakinorhabdus rubra TaxID=2672568 RepID=UPI0013D93F96|nr:PEPxxWA-CTERM sorting domain-containing protein [Sandarakinorhabdus rubra]